MMEFATKAEFDAELKRRLEKAREAKGMTHAQMAHALGIKEDAYKKYENRPKSFFPIWLLPQLVFVTGTSYSHWLDGYTGKVTKFRKITH